MITVSIVNQKGGVAKTTTAANLGACLARRGHRTLLVDLDPQANLTLGLGVRLSDPNAALHEVLMDSDETPLRSILHPIGDLPLFLAPGHIGLATAEAMLLPLGGKAYRLRHALEALLQKESFDWVLLDCPPSLGTLTQNAIVASTHLLIPTEPKLYSYAGMDTLNTMIRGLTKDLRFQVELLGVLLTMCERGTRLHRAMIAEIRERFGNMVFETAIYKNVRLSESELERTPVSVLDPRAPASRSYDALADEVLARVRK